MAYIIGDFIAASHYNNFITSVNKTFSVGTGNAGYGGSALASVLPGAQVFGVEWLRLRNAIDDCNVHQGINVSAVASAVALPASDDFQVGEIILAYSGEQGRWNLERNASAIFDSRLDLAAGETLLTADEAVSARSTSWSVQLVHEFTVTFASTEDARLFFNQGGKIDVNGRRVGGASNPRNDDWTAMLNNGPMVFGATEYYNEAATAFRTIQSITGSAAAYSANDWTLKVKRDEVNGFLGSQGKVLTFRVEFNDDVAVDSIDGSIVSNIDTRSSVGRFTAPTPTYATITELTAGS
jgi:hypothetical protein